MKFDWKARTRLVSEATAPACSRTFSHMSKCWTPDLTTLKKSKLLSNWPKWLIVTQRVLFGSQDLEIRSHVSSFSD